MTQYLTLEQAAQILRVSVERMKEMVKKNELRAFLDRGVQRFRSQDIDEKARQMGIGSDPELALGDAALKTDDSPSSSGRRRSRTSKLGDTVPARPSKLDATLARPSKLDATPARPSKLDATPARPSKLGPISPPPPRRSGLGKRSSRLDPPKASSDSEIRLVGDTGELNFDIDLGDDLDLAAPASSPGAPGSRPGTSGPESGVRIVPLDEDSDAKLDTDQPADSKSISRAVGKSPSDSDIRLEQVNPGSRPYEPLITEEIDLDAEESEARKQAPPPRAKPGSSSQQPALPTSSPFELSESDLELEPLQPDAGPRTPKPSEQGVDSSSDFELEPGGNSDELSLSDEDAVDLGEMSVGGPQASGINLQDPGDSGISLEPGGSDELEIGLAPVSDHGKAPASGNQPDSSSEFELSLDDEEADSSSEFELTLDDDDGGAASAPAMPDSDSEFELTLDEDDDLAASDANALEDDEEGKDIFEPTDFDVPALDDESASEAVALSEMGEGEEGSSEFDLDLEDEEMGGVEEDIDEQVAGYEEDDGSEFDIDVDEDADAEEEPAARPAKSRRRQAAVEEETEEEDPYAQIHDDDEEAEEETDRPAAAAAPALPPAEWGVFPVLMLVPTLFVLFFVGLMSYELSRSMLGYRGSSATSTGMILKPMAKNMEGMMP